MGSQSDDQPDALGIQLYVHFRSLAVVATSRISMDGLHEHFRLRIWNREVQGTWQLFHSEQVASDRSLDVLMAVHQMTPCMETWHA
jgi:hypothetical protein